MNTATNQPKNKFGIGKIILIVIATIIVLSVIANIGKGDKASSSSSSESAPAANSAASSDSKPTIQILQHNEKIENMASETMRTIHVTVQNNGSSLEDYVEVKATWYDKDGKVVGTGMGNTTNLASGAKRTIDVLGLSIEKAVKYDIEALNMPF
ncbi:hypothetical protein GFS24_12280 [Chitinophaga sp. SYP-B3965]|uniref:FxLYD domain-containing protein n=1 Tax=Chitinophaga sp. SYP-B3965 TaxID=2663120 RepID=UPI00129A0AE1|nr:FxLYD domain-containing protein [Chitinophaga sp. SYP-B3965]MRG45898.1 hypothetical protein [Chitinophaga sp. SYP-B3965]